MADKLASECTVAKAGQPLTVSVASGEAAIAALRIDYDFLTAACGNTLPFSCLEWHLSWCRHLLSRDSRIADTPIFQIVRDPSGVCVAILPLIHTIRTLGRMQVKSIAMLGADPGLTEIRLPLVHPAYADRVAAAVDASLRTTHEWDWIQWCGACDTFDVEMGRRRHLLWQQLPPCYVLDLPSSWEEFRRHLKRNIRESLRHCYNSLHRAGHRFEFVVASTIAEIPPALERFAELHRLRATFNGAIPHADRFANDQSRMFLHEVCERFGKRGDLRIFQITIGGAVVASRVGFIVGDSLYLYYSGFDPKWADFSVMTTLVAESIKYAISLGLKAANLSPGTDVSKTRWGPRAISYQTAYEQSARWRSRLALQAYQSTRYVERLPTWLQQMIPGRRPWS